MGRTKSSARTRRAAAVATLALAVAVTAIAPGVANAQAPYSATVVEHQITGPPSLRLNLVILGDGYTADEQWKFRRDVDRNLNVLWSVEPFRSYRNYFNIYRLEIVSPESGIRCDPDADPPNPNLVTALRLHFSDGCTNPLARGITYGPAPQPGGGCPSVPGDPAVGLGDPRCSGSQQRAKYMAIYFDPIGVTGQNVQTLALSNTFTYGGIGGTQATTSGGSPQGPLISMHELGHSLGQLQDEYPYSARDVPGGPHPDTEPGSIHHSRLTHDEMVAGQLKWWRWLCEESLSGGIITARGSTCGPPHESGATRSSNIWRPSEHSMMRWLGFYFDQIGREHMTYRITGRRNAAEMALAHTPTGEVGPADVLWVETGHPKYHELEVAWSVNGVTVPGTGNSRNLDLGDLAVAAGDVVGVTVKDTTEFVRDPAFLDGPRMTQTRQWTVGAALPPAPVDVAITLSTDTSRPVSGDEVVYVETTHPTDRVLDVTWRLNGAVVPNGNSRNFDLGAQGLAPGTYSLSATVTDPADPGGASATRSWTVDNVLPTAPKELSEAVYTVERPAEPTEYVYTGAFTMGLEPTDDQPGFVVGEFRLDRDGWFNYFGFPEEPFGTPFTFAPAGTSVKALTYGNLGTGGLSKATFEQSYPDFVPGYGRHTVEHRAIDAAGNIGGADEFRATVLPFSVSQDSLSEALVEGEATTASFTVTNTLVSGRSFDWTISEAPSDCLAPADVGWLEATPSVTTAAGESATVDVTLDAAGLTAPDMHTAKLCIEFEGSPVYEVAVTLQVRYPFDGFLATFENPPVLNEAHSRGVQDLWFRLGGDRGLDILADASSRRIDCATKAPLGPFSPAETPPWTGLSYQAHTDRYLFPWRTTTAYRGTCRELVLTLDDGSEHAAWFQFVK
jgi:hypothetical protein